MTDGSASHYVAVDLGAESGRVMLASLAGGRMALREAHRFANLPVRTPDGLHWDVLHLFAEILAGLRAVADLHDGRIDGIGIDSWACDYGLLDETGRLLGNPYHYRDARTDGVREEVARQVPAPEQYARTGIAQLPFNTLFQLAAQRWSGDPALLHAADLLLIPDLLHYWLAGSRATEYTNATTTGMLGTDGAWATDILARLDIPAAMLHAPVPPGTVIGELRRAVCDGTGLGPVPVIAPATHDTGSAVVAVPMSCDPSGPGAYISSGTWSLLGLELQNPVTSEEARLAGFTNEGGVGGTYRFLTNIMGLWLIQECRRSWERRGRHWGYEELTALAAATPSPDVVIDVDDTSFFHPDDMVAALNDHFGETGQRHIDDPGSLIRAVFDSLALAYRSALQSAERLAGVRAETVHVVGGGSRNAFLCQLTADACGIPVVAGPAEATALGNALVQAMGDGRVRGLLEAREVVRESAVVQVFAPSGNTDWKERSERLAQMRGRRVKVQTTP